MITITNAHEDFAKLVTQVWAYRDGVTPTQALQEVRALERPFKALIKKHKDLIRKDVLSAIIDTIDAHGGQSMTQLCHRVSRDLPFTYNEDSYALVYSHLAYLMASGRVQRGFDAYGILFTREGVKGEG
jgi:hypothetical protein